jgi:hypothetical protein
MPISPRRIVPNMLLMPALKISNPVEAFIQMVIHDFARRTCLYWRVHTWPALILLSLFATCRMAHRNPDCAFMCHK